MQAVIEDNRDDEIAEAERSYLRECALLLVGAMGKEGAFPADVDGLMALIEHTAEPEPGGRGRRFVAERPTDPPRPLTGNLVFVAPVAGGALRLRTRSDSGGSLAVILQPDGELGQFIEMENSRPTEFQPRREMEISPSQEETQFSNEHLIGVRPAPRNNLEGISVTWLAFYDTGVIVHYLAPHSADRNEGPIELRDDLRTSYSPVGIGNVELAAPPLRSIEFSPAVPIDASRLTIEVHGSSVDISMASRE